MKRLIAILFLISSLFSQVEYNHPEIQWETIETDHFFVHFYDGTEMSAREGAAIAEKVYPHVTGLYDYEPKNKTHIVFLDTDDISNGAAYFYDNKIYIWSSPLDYELRGSHRWLQNVITHEFTHIISIQKAMKFGKNIPGAYIQWMGYENEKRKDVLYGYPNALVSYPIPGTIVPPWFAEGTAQYMYEGADWDVWDSHRDMILRDRFVHDNLLSFVEMNTFGKKGIGNESTYNAGYAICRYAAEKYGPDVLKSIMSELSKPLNYSINRAINNSIGINGHQLYNDFVIELDKKYSSVKGSIKSSEQEGEVLISEGTTNLHPIWAPNGKQFAFLSNQENDYFSQTDLYIYNLETKEQKKIMPGVHSAVTWGSDTLLYYSKKSKYPNKYGSKYYELFEYDLDDEKEEKLTTESRAFSPVYIQEDSSIAYIATQDGVQNIYLLKISSKDTTQLTKYKDHRVMYSIDIDPYHNFLLVDYTLNHFRNISTVSLDSKIENDMVVNQAWDERDPVMVSENEIIYSDDRTGIFNLYYQHNENNQQGYCTNVLGGAFMPDVNQNGQIVYSLYKNGQYTIALLDSIKIVSDSTVGYAPDFYRRNTNLNSHIKEEETSSSFAYKDAFPPMFILPKIMFDYGTVKPGLFFYSSEILHRLSLFGGASINSVNDLDLFFLFEFKRFYPTLFTEVFYLTRNKTDQFNYRNVIPIDDNLKFRMIAFRGGLKFPIFGSQSVELYTIWQRYRAYLKRTIDDQLAGGLAYDYYRGVVTGLNWDLSAIKPRFDGNINPSNGFEVKVDVAYENNDFITGLDFSDAGTLVEEFKANDFGRINISGIYHLEIPYTDRMTVSAYSDLGWINSTKIDSFFNYFAGGMDGIKGYSYYSIEGSNKAIGGFDVRIPIFSEKHYALGWFIAQNSIIGFTGQIGDAWTKNTFDPKKSIGIKWRVNGFSFYNYPTAIGLEAHYGIDKIEKSSISYGQELRWYFTMLFGF